LHTFPRVLGYVFNPVSFWYALRIDGSLAAVVAEVNNTFGERHCYLLSGPTLRWGSEMQANKVFHVSPFCAVEGRYRFRFLLRGALASAPHYTMARIDHDDAGGALLQTSVSAKLQPLRAASTWRALLGMPLMTFGVVARIHWQALRLGLKRVPFHRQAARPERFDIGTRSARPAPAAARAVLGMLPHLKHGLLELRLPDGSSVSSGQGALSASLRVEDWNVFARALRSGDIGFAEAYIAGEWDSPDLTALLTLLTANRDELERVVYGSWWGSLLYRARHALNRNSRRGSAKNIHAHYDLGNGFYAKWLDSTMSYSSAWFDGDFTRPLAQAQDAKLRRVLVESGVTSGSRLLEIGCGWGGLAEAAARDFGAHVTGITLSREQLAWAQQRVAAAGVAQRCDLRLQDYRDLAAEHEGRPFDALVSIEMFEAVGREYWDSYFDTLRRCLKPGGLACIQSITIRDDLFERYLRSTDFIQQYIFPGGLLPSVSQFEAQARRFGFTVERRLAFGLDYAETLRRWRAAFGLREQEVRRLGFDERFMRIWHFYLAYCEAAFTLRNTDVVQFTLRRD
jgi:cyclopropane-fatty-acyl-phospholipid synthase